MKRMRSVLVVAAMLAAITGVVTQGAGNGWWKEEASASELPAEVQDALLEALVGPEGEYAAFATYAAILKEYGNVNPYTNIMEAEATHIAALTQLLDRYHVAYPIENPYLGVIEAPKSLAVAAQAGVDAEIANVALYAQQLEIVADYPDIADVFLALQAASLERHLPAFERATARF